MSTERDLEILRLKRELEDERKGREQEKEAREQEKKAREQAEFALQEATRNTTFDEYLHHCFTYLTCQLSVETIKTKTTKGSTTNVKGKICPNQILPWEGFNRSQAHYLDQVRELFHHPSRPPPQVFENSEVMIRWGIQVTERKITSEADLSHYERFGVERPSTIIIKKLSEMEQAKTLFNLEAVEYSNHGNDLGDRAEEVQERNNGDVADQLQKLNIKAGNKSDAPKAPQKGQPDQFCTYTRASSNQLLTVAEYKPPHKLTLEDLQTGLRPMDPIKDVIQVIHVTQENQRDQRVCSAIIQAFSYMMENGLEYSYITTGVALVFLWVKLNDPATVYYHLAVPKEDALEDGVFNWQRTSVAQVLGLCLMAFKSDQLSTRDQVWRNCQAGNLRKYCIYDDEILRQIPEIEEAGAKSTPGFTDPDAETFKRSPYITRAKARSRCNPKGETIRNKQSPDESDDDLNDNSPLKGKGKITGPQQQDKAVVKPRAELVAENKKQHQTRPYCTQKCLLGICHKLPLDKSCPNHAQHPRQGNRHTVDLPQFTELVKVQLYEELDMDCEPLGIQGARGALFKISLASHGYVFVAKGTVEAFLPDLRHEGKVYQHLDQLQGKFVPVYLGNIDMARCYYLTIGVRIIHMLLMSWAGECMEGDDYEWGAGNFSSEVKRTVTRVERAGVSQRDVRPPNMLWNEENNRPMLIDFERSVIHQSRRAPTKMRKGTRALQETSQSKKKSQDERAKGKRAQTFDKENTQPSLQVVVEC